MASFKPDRFSQSSRDHKAKSFGFCNWMAFLGMVSSVMVMAGCGATGSRHRQCRSRSVHSAPCRTTAGINQPSCCQSAATPFLQAEETSQTGQALMGGSGLATGESFSLESPVEVAPVPPQWSQPVERNTINPAIETEPDLMELGDGKISDPMEI